MIFSLTQCTGWYHCPNVGCTLWTEGCGPPPVGQGGGPQHEELGKSLDYLYGCMSVAVLVCTCVYVYMLFTSLRAVHHMRMLRM